MASYGQADFPEGVQISGGQPTVTTVDFLTATRSDGLQQKLLPVNLPISTASLNALNLKEDSANKQNSLAVDGTGTKFPTVDAVRASLPVNYSKIVYVNNSNPNSATIFDLNNPPTVNDNLLKSDVNNLYVANDASTWVYNSTTVNYVTKTVTSATSNFYLAGTTTDAGNSKTAHISRAGNVGADTFIKNASAINNSYASVANNSLVIGNRGVGAAAPSIMSRTASATITAMNLITMQTSDVARTAESDLSFRNGYEAGGDAILGYSSAGSAFGFYNGADITLSGFRNGNININPPGTLNPTNAGYRLDVGGTARIQSTLTTAADIMSTGVVQTNSRFTAINPYTSGQVGTAGVSIQISPRTITNSGTAASGTVAQHVNNGFLIPTFAATNTGITYTNASNIYIDGAPVAGANITITNPWSLYVNAGKSYFGAALRFGFTPVTASGTPDILVFSNTSTDIQKIPYNTFSPNLLTGYISGAGVVSATDTVLQAIQKLNGNDALKENTANKQNSLAVDGTGAKFPTVDAVNAGITAVGRPYKVYTGVIQQSGTSAPTTSTPYENSIGAIVWTYSAVGTYIGTLAGAFPTANKVTGFIFNNLVGSNDSMMYIINRIDVNSIRLEVYRAGIKADGELNTSVLELRVYK